MIDLLVFFSAVYYGAGLSIEDSQQSRRWPDWGICALAGSTIVILALQFLAS